MFKPKNHSPYGMVKEAKRMIGIAKSEKNPYDFVWVMFDKDGHAKIPEAFELARTSPTEIKIAFTIPCFEYFVLLHFDKTTKPFTKCDDVIHQIKKNWLPDYEKATNIFDILLPKKDVGLAHSEWVVNQFNEEIQSVIIEGGRQTLQTFIDANIWDEARVFKGNTSFENGTKAPKISFKNIKKQHILEDELLIIFNHD